MPVSTATGRSLRATTVNVSADRGWGTRTGRWAAAVAWAVFIAVASSLPSLGRLPLGARGADKMVHLCAYFILGYLVRRALDRGRTPGHSPVTVGMVLCVVWALADELHQTFVPLRSPEVWDFLADVAGSGAGIAVSHVRQRTEDRLAKGEQDGNGS